MDAISLTRALTSVDKQPSRPFESVANDLFQVAGKTFLMMVDRFLGALLVASCGHMASSEDVIRLMKDWFSDKGMPVKLTTDGRPQFSSRQFKDFTDDWGITDDVSSPYDPQANGCAEAAVKAVKALVLRSTRNGNINVDSYHEALIKFQNMPREHGLSPAQFVYGQLMRSQVPTHLCVFKKEW